MARDFYISGETLVTYAGQELALAEQGINITVNFKHEDCIVDAWGPQIGPDIQMFLTDAYISFQAVNFDPAVLNTAIGNSMGGTLGTLGHAGARLGAGGLLKPLVLTSPVLGKPWSFPTVYLVNNLGPWPIGTKRSIVSVQFRAMAYAADPYAGGAGASGKILWTYG